MKHYIIAKFNEGCEWKPMIGAITELFEETLQIPGIHAVKVKPCCINRPNSRVGSFFFYTINF